jgi:hypothetical protein
MKLKFLSSKTIFAVLVFISSSQIFAQNVAINTSGAVANASAILDISSTNSGLLIPRVALTATNAVGPIAGPATSLMVYNTATASAGATAVTPGYYYWDGAQWVRLYNTGNAWQTTGNYGTNPAVNFAGTADAQDFVLRTNNIERLRILASGNIGVGIVVPVYPFHVVSGATASGFFNNTTASSDALLTFNTAGTGAGVGAGLFAISYQSGLGSAGVWAQNGNTNGTAIVGAGNNVGASVLTIGSGAAFTGSGFGMYSLGSSGTGTGIIAAGNNIGSNYLIAGSGGAFNGLNTAVYLRTTTAGVSEEVYSDNFGNIVRVNYWNGGTQYKINGGGAVSCVVPDLENKLVTMHCTETPEFYYQDYGQGQLINGVAHIELDPIFAKNIAVNENHPLRVFIQLENNEFCLGVVVKNKTNTGFDVVEMNGGTSNTPFQWSVVCNAADQEFPNGRISKFADLRFEPAIENQKTGEAGSNTLLKTVKE